MTRDQIIDLIRESYDPVPRHWHANEASGWDDGTGDIADKILAAFVPAQQQPTVIKDFPGRAVAAHLAATGALPGETQNEIKFVHDELQTAIRHLEHMAAWIGKQNSGYSFESLGEDMPSIHAALECARVHASSAVPPQHPIGAELFRASVAADPVPPQDGERYARILPPKTRPVEPFEDSLAHAPQEWVSEVRDFLQDIVGGAEITERSREHAKEFVAQIDAEAPPPQESLPAEKPMADQIANAAARYAVRNVIVPPAPQESCRCHNYMLRGGPGHDYPCNIPSVIECAKFECQSAQRCAYAAPSQEAPAPHDSGAGKRCPKCDGSGDHPGGPPGNQQCPVCDGTGWLSQEENDGR